MRTFTSSLLVLAAASCVATQSTFALVPLEPPDNWQAGPNLFPSQVIAGYKDNLTASDGNLTVWTEDSWAVHVLSLCASFSACTSSVTFQGKSIRPLLLSFNTLVPMLMILLA